MSHRNVLSAALLATAFLNLMLPPRAGAADFTATQVRYSALQGKSAVLFTWNDPAGNPGTVTILRGATVLAAVIGSSGANAYTADDVPAGQFTFSANGTSGSLGSQVQTVLADHADLFGDPSTVVCNQQENEGDCEIIIDWENGSPLPGAYDIILDGSVELSQPPTPPGAVISGATAGERCVSVVSTMVVPSGQNQGRFRGEPVESCCTITCGATVCGTPQDFAIGQVKYGPGNAANAVLARWKLPAAGSYANGIKTLVRGAGAGTIPGSSTRTLFDGLATGTYEFAIQGDCGDPNGLSGNAFDLISLRSETPHKNPVAGSLTCEWNPDTRQTTASWTNADPSKLIDVFIVENGARSYVTTIPGDQTRVTLSDTQTTDRIELQFFALAGNFCYGSEPVICESGSAGNRFIGGVCNGTGSKPGISSAIFGLNYLFAGGSAPPCEKACRINEGGSYDLSDMVYLLNYLFIGGPPPASWGGPDPKCETAPAEECGESNAACPG